MKTAPAIWVKDFAKDPSIGSSNSGKIDIEDEKIKEKTEHTIELPADIETISLSSDDNVKPVIRKTRSKQTPKRATRARVARTPKPKENQPSTILSSAKKGRTPKLPSQYRFHKIDEYFQATKRDLFGLNVSGSKLSSSMCPNGNASKCAQVKEKTEVERLKSDYRQAKIVLRRLSIDQNVDTTRKRKPQDDQSKLPEFIEYKSSDDTYFRVYEQSKMPSTSSLQSQMPYLQSLKTESNVELDSILPSGCDDEMSSNAYGEACSVQCDVEMKVEPKQELEIDSKSRNNNKKTKNKKSPPKKVIRKLTKLTKITKALNGSNGVKTKRPKVECPHYKIIEGTKLAVDAFRYGDIEGVKHYFLSHFHADHYIGLKKSFNHTLYVSNITARLVMEFVKVDERYIRYLDINTPIVVDEIEVTALDANHCPGAVMFLFKLKTGKCILHTGDFRASSDMEEYPEFWNNDIHTIYLDTTYLSSRYEFATQSDSIDLIVKHCREFVSCSSSSAGKPLIICGAYKIGKEKVWLRIAQEFGYKVWIDNERRKAMQCIQNDEIFNVLTQFAKDGQIHVLPLGNISYKYIVDYVAQFGESFQKVLAIRPSGWEREKSKPNFANRISILGIQYSEHSNYIELKRFVRFLRPKTVYSTVPINGRNLARTPSIPKDWFNHDIQPKTRGYQRNIMDFMVKKSPSNDEDDSTIQPKPVAQKSPEKLGFHQMVECVFNNESDDDDDDDDYMP